MQDESRRQRKAAQEQVRHATFTERNAVAMKPRFTQASHTGQLSLRRCVLDPVAVRQMVDCLLFLEPQHTTSDDNDNRHCQSSIHTLDLAYARWYKPAETLHTQSLPLLTDCLRQAQLVRTLQILDLSFVSLGNAAAVSLLQSLVQGAAAAAAAAKEQKDTPQLALRQVHLRQTGLQGFDAGQALAAFIQAFPGLQVLNLAQNRGLGADGARALARGLTQNSSLQQVHFYGCRLQDGHAAVILAALSVLPKLDTLVLAKNCLGLASRQALGNLLQKTTSLRVLNISHHGSLLATNSVHVFATCLAQCCTLQELDLSFCLASVPRMTAVLQALAVSSQSLTKLTMDCAIVSLLVPVLHQFTALHTLIIHGSFEWNNIATQRAFLQNTSLRQAIVVLDDNDSFLHKAQLQVLVQRNRILRQRAQPHDGHDVTNWAALYPCVLQQWLTLVDQDKKVAQTCILDLLRSRCIKEF